MIRWHQVTSIVALTGVLVRLGGGLLTLCGYVRVEGEVLAARVVTGVALGVVAEFHRSTFFAVEPGRASADLVPVYTVREGLTTEHPNPSAKPLFYALSKSNVSADNPAIVSLYEYRHAETDQRRYSTDPALAQRGWVRTGQPLCRVWTAPPGELLIDRNAKPSK